MPLDIDEEALAFIRGKGGVCTISQIFAKNTCADLPQTVIAYSIPESQAGHDRYELDGVVLYISRRLTFTDASIKIRLGRFLGFRWLELPNFSLFAAAD